VGRDSHKVHFLGGSHLLTFFPTFLDCNTAIQKKCPLRGSKRNKISYDLFSTNYGSKIHIYLNKCSHFGILLLCRFKAFYCAKFRSKNRPNSEVYKAHNLSIARCEAGSMIAPAHEVLRGLC